jgi:uncharacterized membrane protein YdjX (TVP38/TMEM64 family)
MQELFGLFILFLSMIVQVIVPPVPAELIVISASKLYGVFLTTIAAGTGLYIGSIFVFFAGKYIHKRFDRFFSHKKITVVVEKLKRFHSLLLWIRILPYNPSDLISYAAGMLHIKTRKFVTISLFTSYIRTFLLAYLGIYITNISTFFIALSILILSAIIGYSIAFTRLKK